MTVYYALGVCPIVHRKRTVVPDPPVPLRALKRPHTVLITRRFYSIITTGWAHSRRRASSILRYKEQPRCAFIVDLSEFWFKSSIVSIIGSIGFWFSWSDFVGEFAQQRSGDDGGIGAHWFPASIQRASDARSGKWSQQSLAYIFSTGSDTRLAGESERLQSIRIARWSVRFGYQFSSEADSHWKRSVYGEAWAE